MNLHRISVGQVEALYACLHWPRAHIHKLKPFENIANKKKTQFRDSALRCMKFGKKYNPPLKSNGNSFKYNFLNNVWSNFFYTMYVCIVCVSVCVCVCIHMIYVCMYAYRKYVHKFS